MSTSIHAPLIHSNIGFPKGGAETTLAALSFVLVARTLAITASRDLGKNLACCCRQDGARRQTSMASRIHRAKHYRSAIAGIAPMMFVSDHHFPRHSHDQFGVGVIVSGGQRSWSGQDLPSEVTYAPLL